MSPKVTAPPNLLFCGIRRYALLIGMNFLPFSSMRVLLLRLCGVSVGKKCYVGFNVIPDTNYPALIKIEDNVTISHNTVLIAHTQSPASNVLSEHYNYVKPVKLSRGSWLGMNVVVLPGVTVGENSFIGAGSVVTSDSNPFSVCVGNPIKQIKVLA